MKVKKINSSSLKTNKKIKEAFAFLMKEKKNLNNITVTELVKKADITRASFYTHYDSIYDVADEFQNETLDILINNLNDVKTVNDFESYIDIIFEFIKQNEKTYTMLLSSDDPLLFTKQLNKHFTKYILDMININNDYLKLKVTFYTDGCMNLLIKYFKKELSISLEQLRDFIKTLFNEIFVK